MHQNVRNFYIKSQVSPDTIPGQILHLKFRKFSKGDNPARRVDPIPHPSDNFLAPMLWLNVPHSPNIFLKLSGWFIWSVCELCWCRLWKAGASWCGVRVWRLSVSMSNDQTWHCRSTELRRSSARLTMLRRCHQLSTAGRHHGLFLTSPSTLCICLPVSLSVCPGVCSPYFSCGTPTAG